MAHYSAVYCHNAGASIIKKCRAGNYDEACQKLPRFLEIRGIKFRRKGGPQMLGSNKK